MPVTDADWDDMATHGFDVVRLLVSWSKLEPRRGTYDHGYLARVIRQPSRPRVRRGIYTVIDMHQDAWGKYIATPTGVTCARPARARDRLGRRTEVGDADRRRRHLHRRLARETPRRCSPRGTASTPNRDGIMDELVRRLGRRVGRAFRDGRRPSPATTSSTSRTTVTTSDHAEAALGTYYAQGDRRDPGEPRRAAARSTTSCSSRRPCSASPSTAGFTTDENIVFAPHNYGESIGDIPIEGLFDYFAGLATQFGTAMWIGEYGWFSDPPASAQKLARYAAKEDCLLTAGDTWWQWRQACGDPHSIGTPGGTPDAVLIHFQAQRLPG